MLNAVAVQVVLLPVIIEVVVVHATVNVMQIQGFNDNYKSPTRILAVRHGEEHHLHRHEGLPIGLQILLPRGKEREGTHALGCGQDFYRLCA